MSEPDKDRPTNHPRIPARSGDAWGVGLWQSAPPVNWSRWWWIAVPMLGLTELVAHAYFAGRPPDEAEWKQITATVEQWRQDDELVVVAPYWAEPHARRVLGDRLMPLSQVARPDDERFEQAIEVSILGHDSPLAWPSVEETTVGKFRIRRLQNPEPSPTLIDFVDLVGPKTAHAATLRRNKRTPCKWTTRGRVENGALHGHPTFPKRRFECGGGNWHFVGVTVIEDEQYRPRRCIWAHPATGKVTTVRFDDVQLGTRLVGYGGLPWFLERETSGAPVTLDVFIDDKKLGQMTHEDGEGWKRFELSTEPFAQERHSVEFRVSAKRTHQREFCFQVDVR